MSATDSVAYLNVFTVKEFETKDGERARKWTLLGVAFPHAKGPGFNLELQCVPLDGKLVALSPNAESRESAAAHNGANGQLPLSSAPASEPPRRTPDPAPPREPRNPPRDRRR
jgi:hypothetical protein